MRIRRAFPITLAIVTVAAAVTLAVQLRKIAPPEPARLLPGADGFVYANLGWARKANGGKLLLPVAHDPEYDRFIQETGFDFERDLDSAAFAVHYPENWPGGGTGGAASEPRFSEVFTGRFDGSRCLAYLKRTAASVETYNSIDIFTIPLYGRSFRIAILAVDTVAASNHDDPAVIRGIVDRSRRLASPFGGPALLRRYYKRVQLASLAWVVARIDPASPGVGSWNTLFGSPATVVVSGSYLSPLHLRVDAVHLRAEAFTQSPDEAQAIADKATVFIALTHSAETSVGTHGTDPDVKAFFDSLKVREEGDRAVLTAVMPFGFLRKMLSGSTPELSEPLDTPPA